MRPLQRFRLRRPSRFGEWYLAGAILLTLAWLLARSLAPAGGLTRSYYHPLPRDANPPMLDTRTLPVVEEPAAGVDLAFLEELDPPIRDYFVRWRGVWFSPRPERIDFRASADDGVIVRIDGEVVLDHRPAVGRRTEMRSVALEAGAGIVRLTLRPAQCRDEHSPARYHRHRFPPDIISHAVWLYHRYCMSFRDVEDLLAERGIIVSYETVRQWCGKFGPDYARQLKRRQGRLGDTWFLDEVFVTINGQRQYLWRAVDQDGDLIDILVQPRRDGVQRRDSFADC